MSYENMTIAELIAAWDSASADLRGCGWHHRSAHKTISRCTAELTSRGFFDRPSCWDINKVPTVETVEID